MIVIILASDNTNNGCTGPDAQPTSCAVCRFRG